MSDRIFCNIAYLASKCWGNSECQWEEHMATNIWTFKLDAYVYGKECHGKWHFTHEFLVNQSEQDAFLIILKYMCDYVDNYLYMQYTMFTQPFDFGLDGNPTIITTTSSYKFLEHNGHIDRVLKDWYKPQTGGFVGENVVGDYSFTKGQVKSMMGEYTSTDAYSDSGELLRQKFPGILELATSPCKCGRGSDSIHNIIIHLNDASHHGMSDNPEGEWTREMIADWLETLDTNLELKEEM